MGLGWYSPISSAGGGSSPGASPEEMALLLEALTAIATNLGPLALLDARLAGIEAKLQLIADQMGGVIVDPPVEVQPDGSIVDELGNYLVSEAGDFLIVEGAPVVEEPAAISGAIVDEAGVSLVSESGLYLVVIQPAMLSTESGLLLTNELGLQLVA